MKLDCRSSSALTLLVFHLDPVQTLGLPSVGESPNVRFSFLVAVGFEPTSL